MPETIGIYGGSFDPPHLGHLILAAEALAQLQLARLLWVLTPEPPHKTDHPLTSLPQRLEMLRRAIAGTPQFELSTVELDRPGPHYTIETLEKLRTQLPAANFVLLIGGDSLRDLPTWQRPAEIISACHAMGVMRRPGDSIDMKTLEDSLPGLGKKVRFVDAPQLEISSSTIRSRVANGGHYRYYLSPSVYEYIEQEKLYR
jgi:nicotinate-nucleotide adenylyltransferase